MGQVLSKSFELHNKLMVFLMKSDYELWRNIFEYQLTLYDSFMLLLHVLYFIHMNYESTDWLLEQYNYKYFYIYFRNYYSKIEDDIHRITSPFEKDYLKKLKIHHQVKGTRWLNYHEKSLQICFFKPPHWSCYG